ncbi:Response regulator receiver domain-containing protein [Arenibacter nanhaiticus]|uniref:Response regulator receiver domain-containing protein n=1 Tax=Arenibacter nanhaiticus TaxID=558155 RepID=A0A1M6B0N6_9FLAO|nr:Hpt domain-containing protein [Arenibacter nanhaiticus]SHI42282.1 Response regulator receiver domain-containing protein [Arenibacter nanhaiticus]
MDNKNIILIERQDEERANLKKKLTEDSFEVVDFDNSMSAIQWVMENGNPKLFILEELSSPLDGWKTLDYLRTELGVKTPVLITIETETEIIVKKSQGFLTKPYSDDTLVKIKEFLHQIESIKETDELPKPYSLDYLDELSDGSLEFITESLALFNDSISEKLTQLQEALDQQQFTEIRTIAHSIKPSFQMLLNDHGKELCQSMEFATKPEDLKTLVQELKLEYNRIKKQIAIDFPTAHI